MLFDDGFRFSFDQCTPLVDGQTWHSLELTLLLIKFRDLLCSRKWVTPCVSQTCSLVRCNEAQLPSQSCGGVRAIADLLLNDQWWLWIIYLRPKPHTKNSIGDGLYNRGHGYIKSHLFLMVVSWVFLRRRWLLIMKFACFWRIQIISETMTCILCVFYKSRFRSFFIKWLRYGL
jgi:hypothetical protein